MRLAALIVTFALLAGCSQPIRVEEERGGEPVVTKTVKEFEVLSNTSYIDRQGTTHVVGEARNGQNTSLAFTFAHVRFFGQSGNLFKETARPGHRALIPPGERTPFDVALTLSEPMVSYLVDMTGEDPAGAIRTPTSRVVSSSLTEEPGGVWRVSGQVANSGAASARPQVAVTLYDQRGQVVTTGAAFTSPNDIPPQGTAAFTISFYDYSGSPSSHNATT